VVCVCDMGTSSAAEYASEHWQVVVALVQYVLGAWVIGTLKSKQQRLRAAVLACVLQAFTFCVISPSIPGLSDGYPLDALHVGMMYISGTVMSMILGLTDIADVALDVVYAAVTVVIYLRVPWSTDTPRTFPWTQVINPAAALLVFGVCRTFPDKFSKQFQARQWDWSYITGVVLAVGAYASFQYYWTHGFTPSDREFTAAVCIGVWLAVGALAHRVD
jgi:hypothetical protein